MKLYGKRADIELYKPVMQRFLQNRKCIIYITFLFEESSWIRQREKHTRSIPGLSRYESCDPPFHIPVQISIYRRSRIHHLAELCKMAESYVMIRQHKPREKGRDLLGFVGFSFTEKFLTFIHKKRNIRIKSIFCKYRIHFWYVRWRTGLRLKPTGSVPEQLGVYRVFPSTGQSTQHQSWNYLSKSGHNGQL